MGWTQHLGLPYLGHICNFAHAEDVDQLARVLKAAVVGPVVDALRGESRGEAGNGFELLERGLVEVDAYDHSPRRGLGEGYLDLLSVLQATGEVRQFREVGVGTQ